MSLLNRLRTALKRYLEARSVRLSERKRWSNHVQGEGNVSPEKERK